MDLDRVLYSEKSSLYEVRISRLGQDFVETLFGNEGFVWLFSSSKNVTVLATQQLNEALFQNLPLCHLDVVSIEVAVSIDVGSWRTVQSFGSLVQCCLFYANKPYPKSLRITHIPEESLGRIMLQNGVAFRARFSGDGEPVVIDSPKLEVIEDALYRSSCLISGKRCHPP